MLRKFGDVYISVFLILVSIAMYIGTFSFKMLTVSRIGPKFVPQLTAIGIFICAIVILIQAIMAIKAGKNEAKDSDAEEGEPEDKPRYGRAALSLALMIVYLIAIPEIGFLITTALYLFVQIYILAEPSDRKIPLFIVISIVASVAVYYVFRSVFHVMLPDGILG